MLTYKTAGESHGRTVAALVEGFPAGVKLDVERIDAELRRRQGGYGRGGRQAIEEDHAEILSGILHGFSTGAPILLAVNNRDYKIESMPDLTRPRPGHADLAGAMKYRSGIRGILERASARETAGRVAAGALAAILLDAFGVQTVGFVTQIGPLSLDLDAQTKEKLSPAAILRRRAKSSVYSLRPEADTEAERLIDETRDAGETLGGIVEVRAFGLPVGLGSHVQWTEKLDARLAAAAMSIQAIKGVEIGLGFEAARRKGSEVHDEIRRRKGKTEFNPVVRPTNNAGGIEGGMTNGEPVVVRAAMKPIATLRTPLESVDRMTGKKAVASYERSDVCAVSAAGVVLENVVAMELAGAMIEKLGGDSLEELTERLEILRKKSQDFFGPVA